MKKILTALLILVLCINPVCAQTTDPEEETPSIETQLDEILGDLNDLYKSLKKQKAKQAKITANKIKLISRKIDRAVKTIPPNSCFEKLKVPMNDFFKLVSDLGIGISCGPTILPPFFDTEPLVVNCIPPPEEDELLRAQVGRPFSEVYGAYTKARDLVQIDTNINEIPDICE